MTNLLLVEDSPFDADLVQATLRNEGPADLNVYRVKRLSEALQSLEEINFDVILLDLTLPDARGGEVFLALQQTAPEVPIVILTGLADAELALETVRWGAQDYLVKDEVLDRALIRAITHAIERKRLHLEAQRLRREALEMERRKTEFLATVSHELRNPMSGIVGFVELLSKTALTPVQAEYVEAVLNSSRAMLRLLHGLLDLSSAESGHVNLEYAPMPLRDSLENLAAFIVPQARAKGLEVVCGVDPLLPDSVMGDHLRLRQIILNLTGNALKFTDRGYIGLFARLRSHAGETIVVRFVVEDSGRGIPADKRDLIFGAFKQTRSEDRARGAGLGLSISKRLIGAMGGVFGLESQEGAGTAMWFDLPFQVLQPSSLSGTLSGRRILLAEDLPSAVEALSYAVHRMGGEIRVVSSPQELAEVLSQDSFDLKISRWPCAGCLVNSYEREDSESVARPLRLSAIQAASSVRVDTAPAPIKTSSMRVLIIEDDELCRKLAAAVLGQSGALCVATESGQAALAAAQNAPFDLVLVDQHLPDIDGPELARLLRKYLDCPIVCVSGNAMENLGPFDSALLKPVPPEQLQLWTEPISQELVDWAILERFRKYQRGHNSNLIADLIRVFLDGAGGRVKILMEAMESQRTEEVTRVAHQLKGAADSVGAVGVARGCRELEQNPTDRTVCWRLQRDLAFSQRLLANYLLKEEQSAHPAQSVPAST